LQFFEAEDKQGQPSADVLNLGRYVSEIHALVFQVNGHEWCRTAAPASFPRTVPSDSTSPNSCEANFPFADQLAEGDAAK
jgi:hypothetical protein